jgi:hypothetical protein
MSSGSAPDSGLTTLHTPSLPSDTDGQEELEHRK